MIFFSLHMQVGEDKKIVLSTENERFSESQLEFQ